jgi:hypothetical protein
VARLRRPINTHVCCPVVQVPRYGLALGGSASLPRAGGLAGGGSAWLLPSWANLEGPPCAGCADLPNTLYISVQTISGTPLVDGFGVMCTSSPNNGFYIYQAGGQANWLDWPFNLICFGPGGTPNPSWQLFFGGFNTDSPGLVSTGCSPFVLETFTLDLPADPWIVPSTVQVVITQLP